jgi:acetoacetyl-CoA reductase
VSAPYGTRPSRLALVTGGTGGIGTEVCRQLAAAGHRVITTHLAHEAALAQAWRRERIAECINVGVIECDVTSFESCATMARHIQEELGTVEILVNCAGITRDKTLAKMEPAQWTAVLDTNLTGAFNVTRQMIGGMIECRYGRIVSIASVNGQKGQFGQTNYSAAKAGLYGFTRALAREVAAQGITANTVSPGYVDTSMVGSMKPEVREAIVQQIPVGRLAEPQEIAWAVGFLVAEESRYITGADLPVNGGLFMG